MAPSPKKPVKLPSKAAAPAEPRAEGVPGAEYEDAAPAVSGPATSPTLSPNTVTKFIKAHARTIEGLQNGLRVVSATSSSTALRKELAAVEEKVNAVTEANNTLEQQVVANTQNISRVEQQQSGITNQLRREVDMHHAALAAPAVHVRMAAHDNQLAHLQQVMNEVLDRPSSKRARSAPPPSPPSEPAAEGNNGSGPSSPAPEPMSELDVLKADMLALKAQLAAQQGNQHPNKKPFHKKELAPKGSAEHLRRVYEKQKRKEEAEAAAAAAAAAANKAKGK